VSKNVFVWYSGSNEQFQATVTAEIMRKKHEKWREIGVFMEYNHYHAGGRLI
jgi:hypothetical protein